MDFHHSILSILMEHNQTGQALYIFGTHYQDRLKVMHQKELTHCEKL